MSLSRLSVDDKRQSETSGDGGKVPHMDRVWHTLCRTLADGAVFQNNYRSRKALTTTDTNDQSGDIKGPALQRTATWRQST